MGGAVPSGAAVERGGRGAALGRRLGWGTPAALAAALFMGGLVWAMGGRLEGWREALAGKLQTLAAVFLGIFIEALPFLLLGVVASALIQLFVSEELIRRVAPRHPLLAPLFGGLLGLAFPVCECGVIPVTRRLLQKGAPLPLGVAFMLAGPVINPVVIVSTWVAFSGSLGVVLGRLGLTLLIAGVVGFIFGCHPQPKALLVGRNEPQAAGEDLSCCRSPQRHGPLGHLGHALAHSGDEFFEMGKYLVLGALIAASIQAFIPRAALLELGQGPVASVLVMMGLGALLSICSTVDSFVALSFASTFSTGSLLAFLVFGPMIDIKSALMFLGVFRRAPIGLLVLLCAQLVFLGTVFINLNIG